MKDPVTWLTTKQAAELQNCSQRHINNLITRGQLSATKEDGVYYIEKSEFFRVCPEAHRNFLQGNPKIKEEQRIRAEIENEFLKEAVARLEKETQFLRSQIEGFSSEKKQMLDAITHHARLLEHKTKDVEEENSWLGLFKRKSK